MDTLTQLPFEEITSKDNQHIKLAASLHEKKYRKEHNLILFEGKTIIEEALKRNLEIESLFFQKEDIFNEIKTEFPSKEFQAFKLNQELMQKIATTDSAPPLIAIFKKPQMPDLLADAQLKNKTGNLFLYCENIQDPGNLGSIIRTAFSAGVEMIYLSPDCADIFNPKTIRSSMGTMFCGPIVYKELKDVKTSLVNFSSQNQTSYEILGTSSHAQRTYQEISVNNLKNFMLLVGNESKGLKKESLEACTMNIKIEMANNIESLNVLAATSIILFDLKNKVKN